MDNCTLPADEIKDNTVLPTPREIQKIDTSGYKAFKHGFMTVASLDTNKCNELGIHPQKEAIATKALEKLTVEELCVLAEFAFDIVSTALASMCYNFAKWGLGVIVTAVAVDYVYNSWL